MGTESDLNAAIKGIIVSKSEDNNSVQSNEVKSISANNYSVNSSAIVSTSDKCVSEIKIGKLISDFRYDDCRILGAKQYCCTDKCLPKNYIPSWLDKQKFRRGKTVANKHFFSVFFAHLSGLILLVHVKSILVALLSTGNSRSVAHLFARYLRTMVHIKLWYDEDVWDVDNSAHKSILQIRKMHHMAASKLNQDKINGKDKMSFSQFDMVVTQFAFVGLIVLYPKQMGIYCSREDLEALIHFWRGIGHLLGIEDRYNLCRGNFDDIQLLCQSILQKKIKTSIIDSPPREALEMSRGIVYAIKSLITLLTWESYIKYLLEVVSIQAEVRLNSFTKVSYQMMNVTFKYMLQLTVFRVFFNYLLKLAIILGNRKKQVIEKRLTRKYPDIVLGQCLGQTQIASTNETQLTVA